MFGVHHWMGIFGPVVALGAVLLLVRWAMTRSLEREFAAGLAALLVASVVVAAADTNVWVNWAGMILKL